MDRDTLYLICLAALFWLVLPIILGYLKDLDR